MTYYHGTAFQLDPGGLIEPGPPGRVYFTDTPEWAAAYGFRAYRKRYGPLPPWALPRKAHPRVYVVQPRAQRTFYDTAVYQDLPAHVREQLPAERWSCKPLTVVRELELTPHLIEATGNLLEDLAHLLAETADLIADVSRQMGAR